MKRKTKPAMAPEGRYSDKPKAKRKAASEARKAGRAAADEVDVEGMIETAKTKLATGAKLVLVRADNGDWSLHPPAGATEESKELITLMSGTARMVGEQWDHPDKRDYELA
jgi:hypothetical protein